MRPSLLLPFFLPLTLASQTSIHNNCAYTLYYAPVDSTPPTPETITPIPPNTSVFQDEWFDGATGTALKITKTSDALWANRPVLQLGYTAAEGEVWYDLSSVNGYDFWGENVVLAGDREGSESIEWLGAPGGTRIAHWVGELGLVLTVCA
ncbi:hypothetical protein BDU57DRAFT_543530 [Ampelomyces quisqualis]|uniref:Uncharacterized protein n=1 Tax=Ampelomyces quisqualis TaxID=50730 RepID=A0A6A5Q6L4_AMPQU|nr:hypothetical protein BDU57DRAFT_543530 [Ampelomyces quisqualis]